MDLVSFLLSGWIAQKPMLVQVAGVITLILMVIENTGLLQVQVFMKVIIGKLRFYFKKAFLKYSFFYF